jgi:hypothetical protein
MSKIKNILKNLSYYLSIRQTGKTTLLKKGVDEYPYYHWIVVPNLNYAKHIVTPSNKLHNLVTLDTLDKLVGTKQAMIIDQQANLQIFQMALDEIHRLEIESDMKTKLAHEIVDLLEMYQDDLHKLQHHFLDGLIIPFWDVSGKLKHKKKSIQLLDYIKSNNELYTKQFKKIKSNFRFEI